MVGAELRMQSWWCPWLFQREREAVEAPCWKRQDWSRASCRPGVENLHEGGQGSPYPVWMRLVEGPEDGGVGQKDQQYQYEVGTGRNVWVRLRRWSADTQVILTGGLKRLG